MTKQNKFLPKKVFKEGFIWLNSQIYQNGKKCVTYVSNYIMNMEFRYAVQKWNERFFAGEAPYFITHSVQKGYKATRDFNEAKIAMNDYISRSRIMEKQARGIQQGFERLNNCKYDFESGEII